MAGIFVSYRRTDSLMAAGRLSDDLVDFFGRDQLFRDVDAIEGGADFDRSIVEALRAAAVELVVIGRKWASVADATGIRRVAQPEDYVRREIEIAFAERIGVIPILVDGAAMPSSDELPQTLAPLTKLQAFEVADRTWRYDVEQLAKHLEHRYDVERTSAPAPNAWLKGVFAAIRDYLPDLLFLLAKPKTLIGRHNLGRTQDLTRALTFLSLSVLLGSLGMLDLVMPERLSLPGLLGAGLVVGVVATLATSLPMYLAWRLVGASPEYRRIAVPLCYQSAVTTLLIDAGFVAIALPLALVDPKFFERLHDTVTREGDMAAKWLDAAQFIDQGFRAGGSIAMAGIITMLLIHVLLLAWLIASWGAYRQGLGIHARWRSLVAFLIFICVGPLAVSGFAAIAAWLSGG
jgi:TIR domain